MSALRSRAPGPALRAILAANRQLLGNAGALGLGTFGTAALGFVYWWYAARTLAPEAVGYAAAAISLVNLLAHLGEIGLGPLLTGELPRRPGRRGALVATALAAVAVSCAAVALVAVGLGRGLSLGLGRVTGSGAADLVFVAGCVVTGFTIVLDQAFVGLLRGGLQMARNLVFAVAKLALLAGAIAVFGRAATEADVFAGWMAGHLLSVAVLAGWLALSGQRLLHPARPAELRPLLGHLAGHHSLNFALQAPSLVLPFVVTVALSPEINAAFYAAWTLISVALLVPASLSAVLYSVGSLDPQALPGRLRLSLGLSLLAGLGAGTVFLVGGPLILRLFNPAYPDLAGVSLRLLGFGTIPLAMKYHYLALVRLQGRYRRGFVVLGLVGAAEIAAASVGAAAGLVGLTAGWLLAAAIGSLVTLPTVLRAAGFGGEGEAGRFGRTGERVLRA